MTHDLFEEMRRMHREIDTLFGDFWGYAPAHKMLTGKKELEKYRPARTDVKETEKEVIATFDIPGADKKDIKIDVTEDSISVKAERKAEVKKEEKGFYRQERSYQGFFRQFALPAEVLPDNASADYKDGVLTVTMPKAKPKKEPKGKRVEIK